MRMPMGSCASNSFSLIDTPPAESLMNDPFLFVFTLLVHILWIGILVGLVIRFFRFLRGLSNPLPDENPKSRHAEQAAHETLQAALPGNTLFARNRIIFLDSTSAELDLVIATPNALYIVETKLRDLASVTGTEDSPDWIATYHTTKQYPFENPLIQVARQTHKLRELLQREGLDVPVFSAALLLGALTLPSLPRVFYNPHDLARWIASHTPPYPIEELSSQLVSEAFHYLVAHSETGPNALRRHLKNVRRARHEHRKSARPSRAHGSRARA